MSGYFSLPRSFTRDPLWLDLPLEYQHVFLVILDHACWKPQKFDDHGVIIDLKPGQLCTTERDLAKKCNKKITRIIVQRAIAKLKVYSFLIQEVIHVKSVLSICDKRIFDLIIKNCEPGNEPGVSQDCARIEPETKKTRKKEDKKTTTPTPFSQSPDRSVVVFYRSLLSLDLPDSDKTKLMRFAEPRVDAAIEYAKTAKIKRTLIATLIWHCQQDEEIPPVKDKRTEHTSNFVDINAEFAKNIYSRCKKKINGMKFTLSANKKNLIIENEEICYEDSPHVFAQQLESALRKRGKWINQEGVDQDLDLSKIMQHAKD